MNNENRKGRFKTVQTNPLPPARTREDSASERLNERGVDMASDGYTVLDRAPLSRFNRERRGLGSAVSDNDGPDDDYAHYGYLP